MQTKMDPCFYKMVLCYMVSMAEVWCRLECPQLLFPLPLPWCAHYPLLLHYSLLLLTFAKRTGELAGRAAARLKGAASAFVRVRLPLTGLRPQALTREPRVGGVLRSIVF